MTAPRPADPAKTLVEAWLTDRPLPRVEESQRQARVWMSEKLFGGAR